MQPESSPLPVKTSILSESAWVVFGQASAALGTLFGIRLLTEFIPPDVFGAVTLISGIVALGVGTFCTPVLQATLRLYPELAPNNGVVALRKNALLLLRRRGAWCYLVMLASWPIYSYFNQASVAIALLVAVMLASDAARALESTLLNAARRQRPFALISISEAWGRPLAAIACVGMLGPSIQSVLGGYIAASLATLVAYYALAKPEGVSEPKVNPSEIPGLQERITVYCMPLIPLGVIGWVSGLGDRYLIGGMLGLENVGIYSAVYGLISRPFLLLGNAVELIFRPLYNQTVITRGPVEAQKTLRLWLCVVFCLGGIGCLIFMVFQNAIVGILVAEEYRTGAVLIPWIAVGYLLLILSYVVEKICYAYGTTQLVLVTQVCGAIASLLIAFVAIHYWGLIGAAIAVPMYFGLQLSISLVAARATKASVEKSGGMLRF